MWIYKVFFIEKCVDKGYINYFVINFNFFIFVSFILAVAFLLIMERIVAW